MRKAIGFTLYGEKRVYRGHDGYSSIYCGKRNLVELYIFKGSTSVVCDNNNLTHIYIPKGLQRLNCEGNNLTELKLPKTMHWLTCDKELFDYDKCKVSVVNIRY